MKKEILFLNPVCTHNIWGGARLREEFGYSVDGNDIGECWGISAHPNGDAEISGGTFDRMKLSELWQKQPELFGDLNYDRFPLLTKIIDAREDLSIQVHPDDSYAMKYENGSYGKTECWYIIDCTENASLVVGHNARSREELADMISQARWDALIREIPIKPGDFIPIEPGTVHAIKGGTLILETQQNSDITYRVYDYDRIWQGSPRELHIEKCMDVITVPAEPMENSVKSTEGLAENCLNELYSCRYFDVFKINVNGVTEFVQEHPFMAVSVIEGEGTLNGHAITKGMHFILPFEYGKVELQGKMVIMASTVTYESVK